MPSEFRVLLVAPTTDLEYRDEEISSVVNSLRPTLLSGNVDVSDLMEYTNKKWDLIWFASHGTEEGILLSDGILPAAQLSTIVRSSCADAVFLNTCESLSVAQAINRELGIPLVCTINQTPDREAYITGRTFARNLAESKSVYTAYNRSVSSSDRNYIYLHGAKMNGGSHTHRPYKSFSSNESDEVLKDLRDLVTMVKGDPDTGYVGIMKRLDDLQGDIEDFHADYRTYKTENNERWLQVESTLKFHRTGMFLVMTVHLFTLIGILALLITLLR